MFLIEKNRKYILLGIITFIILGILMAKVLGNKQDEQFMYEDMLYAQASQMYQEGDYDGALSISNELLKLKPRSEAVNYLGALIAANIGEYKQASILLQKTLDINPYKVDNPVFMLQYGEVLFSAERYIDSKIVLKNIRDRGFEPQEVPGYQERVVELLNLIYSLEEEGEI